MASGMDYTILGHALYADIMVGDLDETLSTGVLRRAGGSAPCVVFLPASYAKEKSRHYPCRRRTLQPRYWSVAPAL
jgi:hypothetical protein